MAITGYQRLPAGEVTPGTIVRFSSPMGAGSLEDPMTVIAVTRTNAVRVGVIEDQVVLHLEWTPPHRRVGPPTCKTLAIDAEVIIDDGTIH